jgi:hypothetical protein
MPRRNRSLASSLRSPSPRTTSCFVGVLPPERGWLSPTRFSLPRRARGQASRSRIPRSSSLGTGLCTNGSGVGALLMARARACCQAALPPQGRSSIQSTPNPWPHEALFVPITVNRIPCCPLVSSRPLDISIGPEGRKGTGLQTNPLAFGRRHETEELSTRGGSHCSQAGDMRGARYAADFLLGLWPLGGNGGLGVFVIGFTPPFFTGPSRISLLAIDDAPP